MTNTFLISENIRDDSAPVEALVENTENGKKTFITGIFAQSELVNGNNRLYPQKILFDATSVYIEDAVRKRNAAALGELNHPTYPMPNAKEACHIISDLWFEGNNVMGKAEVLEDLPNGKIVKSLLDRNVNIGVSTRGLGRSSKRDLYDEITFYKMTAVDVVTDPSAPEAFVKGLMEGVEWIASEDHNIKMDDAVKVIRENENDKLKAITDYIRHIANNK